MAKTPKKMSLRETIQFYLIDCKTVPGKLIDIFIILLNLLILGLFVVESYNISESARAIIWGIEVVTVFFFIVEYIARLYGARDRLKHLIDIYSIIDLLAIIPTLTIMLLPGSPANIGIIKMLRVIRVFRIFRFLRFTADPYFFFGNITWHLLKVVRLVFTIFMIFFVSSGFFLYAEKAVNPKVQNFGDAFYFTVITLTTVGFGDIAPISDGGRAVTVLMILSGIALIPWEVSQIMKEWMHLVDKKNIVCRKCGLKYHDKDASHCKSCGSVIYQEYDGD